MVSITHEHPQPSLIWPWLGHKVQGQAMWRIPQTRPSCLPSSQDSATSLTLTYAQNTETSTLFPSWRAPEFPQVGLTHTELEIPCLGSGHPGLGTQSPWLSFLEGKGEIIFPLFWLISQSSTKDKLQLVSVHLTSWHIVDGLTHLNTWAYSSAMEPWALPPASLLVGLSWLLRM